MVSNTSEGGPSLEVLGRNVVRFLCIATLFFSAGIGGGSLMMFIQVLNDAVPDGVIRSVDQHTRSYHLALEDGKKVSVPTYLTDHNWNTVTLKPQDRISKKEGSYILYVNGQPVTDRNWLMWDILSLGPNSILAGLFLLFNSIYILGFRRTLVDDLLHRGKLIRRPMTVGAVAMGFGLTIAVWVVCVIAVFMFFGCITFGIGGAADRAARA